MHNEVIYGFRFVLLMLMVSLASVAAALITPSLPILSTYFEVDEHIGQLIMTSFLLGYAFGMLPYAPLANRWGRKKTLIGGLILCLIATLLTIWAASLKNFPFFCSMCFLQAIGASSGFKIAMTMIADTHAKAAATRAVSRLMFSFIITPPIGVVLGGIFSSRFGWDSCFYFLAAYSALLICLSFLLPETAQELQPEALQLSRIARAYSRQFKDSFVTLHALIMGIGVSFSFLFISSAPYIGINMLGLSPEQYGFYSVISPIGLSIGYLLAAHFADKQTPRILMLCGILISFVGAIIIQTNFTIGFTSPWALFLPMAVVYGGAGLVSPVSSARVLNEAHDKSSASATLLFINRFVAFFAVYLLSVLPFSVYVLLPAALLICSCLQFFLWFKLKK